MNVQSVSEVNLDRWNRKFLNVFWFFVALSALVETTSMFFTLGDIGDFIRYRIVKPTLILIVIVGVTELAYRTWRRHRDILMISSSAIMTAVVITVHSNTDVILTLLLFPVLIANFYFKKRIALYAGSLGVMELFSLYLVNSDIHVRTSPTELITMSLILIGGTLITVSIMDRGVELLQYLETETKAKEEMIARSVMMDKLTKMDALTGLYNHISFHIFLGDLLHYSGPDSGHFHLALIDIDNFKKINDTFGHQTGDIILKRVSQVIRESVGTNDFAARYGGEEFAVIITDCGFQQAFETIENIRDIIARLEHPELKNSSVTVSIGLHSYEQGESKENFFLKTDNLLYEAKRTGKNKTVAAREG